MPATIIMERSVDWGVIDASLFFTVYTAGEDDPEIVRAAVPEAAEIAPGQYRVSFPWNPFVAGSILWDDGGQYVIESFGPVFLVTDITTSMSEVISEG